MPDRANVIFLIFSLSDNLSLTAGNPWHITALWPMFAATYSGSGKLLALGLCRGLLKTVCAEPLSWVGMNGSKPVSPPCWWTSLNENDNGNQNEPNLCRDTGMRELLEWSGCMGRGWSGPMLSGRRWRAWWMWCAIGKVLVLELDEVLEAILEKLPPQFSIG